MPDRKPEHPAVKIAGIVATFVFIIVLILAVLVPQHLSVVGWIVVPLATMGIALGWFASRRGD